MCIRDSPYTLDYVREIFTDFHELHGDRMYADDQSIVGGLARFNGSPCMVIGHQKGRDTKERAARNFGMPRPEGYRKALRLMRLAEKFGIPVFTFVDTPGAYPGIGAEERGQSEAIGHNLYAMAELKVPVIVTIIGCLLYTSFALAQPGLVLGVHGHAAAAVAQDAAQHFGCLLYTSRCV